MPKPKDQFGAPDPRWEHHVVVESENPFRMHYSDVDDLYQQIEKFKLHERVPEKVRAQFDLALNLYLYHWFVYDFVTVAEQQAYAAVEAALRYRYREELGDPTAKAVFKKLLDYAIAKGWLNGPEYEFPMPGTPTGKFSILEMIRMLRNKLAHGDFHLMQAGSYDSLEYCHQIINGLFPQKESAPT
jgi:hypothetical protein